ncbi:hypothetical protein [Nocardia sp. NPDC127526]|uniref:hypothetical protein n=1 Tax=Nocardia sp. NPDC127526 TaxID=3345393 RepID=UPI0036272022
MAISRNTGHARRIAALGALPIALAVMCAGQASATPVPPSAPVSQSAVVAGHAVTILDANTMTIDGHVVTVNGADVRVDGQPVTFRTAAAPGPDITTIAAPADFDPNKVGTGALIGAAGGAALAGIPAAVVGAVPGVAIGAVAGGVAGFLIGIGTVAAGTLITAMVGCATTGCIIDVPVFIAGLAAEAATALPAIAIGAVLGGVAGGAIGAAVFGLPAAAVGGLVGAGVGAGVGAAAPQAIP